MDLGFTFFFNSIMLGIGLAMDAFSVSLANGLHDPCMRRRRIFLIAGLFALFQAAMPLLGWVCVHTVMQYFKVFEKLIPWIALLLLWFIGGKMFIEGKNGAACRIDQPKVGFSALIIQGIATSIDALSVGFTIADHGFVQALISALLIGMVTFFICAAGVAIGKKAGTKLAGKAGIFGGAILILIGLEIFITGVF